MFGLEYIHCPPCHAYLLAVPGKATLCMDQTANQLAAVYLAFSCCVHEQLSDAVNMGLEPVRIVYVAYA